MKLINKEAERTVSRLGSIGTHEWWHCRDCGDVWATARNENAPARSHAGAEIRLHLATHAQSQHMGSTTWHRAPSLPPMSEKHR